MEYVVPGPLLLIGAWAKIDLCSNVPGNRTTKMFSFSLSNVAKYLFTFKNLEIAYKNEMDYE